MMHCIEKYIEMSPRFRVKN